VTGGDGAASGSDSIARNQAYWTSEAPRYATAATRLWAGEPSWGIFGIPERELHLLPDDLTGLDVVELGCGTAYVSAWVARQGARPVGVDPTAAQLATARAMQADHDLAFPLVQAAGEQVPLRDGCADLVVSEYGAAIWADPYRWIPEAARLLRPGGELVVLGNSTLLVLCAPDDDGVAATAALLRPQFGLHRVEWSGEYGVEFHQSHGDRIRLLRDAGFEILDLLELRPPESESADTAYDFVTVEWARDWPAEEVWRARKR
jgi:SAM-dependent methyltransferase